ncbi:TonB-dependent receptor [Roseivirga sp.]|uniref:TonB-dependent receptor n=1 Tax=Roseivirga sp. TaxID=1964215 RepID=UPI003B5282E0
MRTSDQLIKLTGKVSFILLLTFFTSGLYAQGIRGKIVDAVTKEPVGFATIAEIDAQGRRTNGVSATEEGEFFIIVKTQAPYNLEVSRIGYMTKRVQVEALTNNLVIELREEIFNVEGFEFTSQKLTEEELRMPIEMVRMSLKEIQYTPSFNYYDAIGNLKGIDLTTQSTVINTVNARGFNSSTNPRFRQFIDGIDTQVPGLGFSLGNIIGPSSLDVESVEVQPGPSTALYGPSSFNGVLLINTRSPIDYPGFSFTAKGATAAIEKTNKDFFRLNNFISELSARYAVSFNDKFGVKVSATAWQGVDFHARNYRNKGAGFPYETEYNKDNQSIDGINVYGDDRAAIVSLPIPANGGTGGFVDSVFYATRNGYREEELVDYQASNLKYNAELEYRITDKLRAYLLTQYGKTNAMISGIDRFKLRDFEVQQHKFELKSPNFLFRAYTTIQDAGTSFNVGALADAMNQIAKPDNVWFNQFQQFYRSNPTGIFRYERARDFANTNTVGGYLPRFEPGTERFDSLKSVLTETFDQSRGVTLFDRSKLYHTDIQYNFKDQQEFFKDLLIGASYRLYDPDTQGAVFPDSDMNDITNYEYGIYGQVQKEVAPRLEMTASLRYDKNENFDGKLSQRLSGVYQLQDIHYLRISALRGYRFPTVLEQFQDQFLGDKRVVGGLGYITDPLDLGGNAFYDNVIREYNERVFEEVNTNGSSVEAARIDLLPTVTDGIIPENIFSGIKPEQVTTFEIGYRSLVEEKRIFEVTIYRNYYENFIGNIRVIKPQTSPQVDLQRSVEQASSLGSNDLIFVTANSSKTIITQGIEFLYDITGSTGLNFSVNAAYADIIREKDDPVVPGFNTPPFKWNVTVGHTRISRALAASLTWRSRTTFEWQSPFADGSVDDFSTFDLQLTYRIPEIKSAIRLGANNVHNIDQYNTFGGPEINAFYYLSFSYDPWQIR